VDTLLLDRLMEENYVALQNMLNDSVVKRSSKRRSQFTKSQKRRDRKTHLVKAQGEKCIDCGKAFQLVDGSYPDATADHIIPFRYGSNLGYNMEFVCSPCNNAREKNRMFHVKRYFGSIS
jgi:5-methylcytosine-specific restriction endonuclease McrA